MICDSTNIFSPGRAGSRARCKRKSFENNVPKVKKDYRDSFASNVARMETIFDCTEKINRQVCLVGRSMNRIFKTANNVDICKILTIQLIQRKQNFPRKISLFMYRKPRRTYGCNEKNY